MNKILIFGGRGFIGQHLTKHLLNNNYDVLVLSNIDVEVKSFSKVHKITKIKKIKYTYSDIQKALKLFCPDTIIFLSGNPSFESSKDNFGYDLQSTNITVSNILDSLINLNLKSNFWFGSSVAVYGNNPKRLTEKTPCDPISFYGLSKLLAEKQCEYYSKKYDLNIGVIRIFSTYGPGLKRQIVYEAIKKFMSKGPYNFYGSGKEIRDIIYINDLINGIFLLLKKDLNNFNIFNIGTGKGYSIKYIINLIAKEIGIKPNEINFLNDDKTKISSNKSISSIKLIKKITDFEIKYNLKDGIKKTVNYWKNQK